VWLDNQQFGLARLKGWEQAVQALTLQRPVPSNTLKWAWLSVQLNPTGVTPATQFNVFVAGAARDALAAGKSVAATTANVWVAGAAARHGVAATVVVNTTYEPKAGAGSFNTATVPRQVTISMDGAEWQLVSMCAPTSAPDMWQQMPYNPLVAFESPCMVYRGGASGGTSGGTAAGVGVIEWQVQQADPYAAAAAARVPGFTTAFQVSPPAIATWVGVVVVLAVLITIGIVVGVAKRK
jgi:hypothetical protein